MKPEKRTVAIDTLFGAREVQGEVWADWVVVHRSWAVADKAPWVVAMLPEGCFLARCRLKAEARAIAADVAQTFRNLQGMRDNGETVDALLARHGLRRGPIGLARRLVGYRRGHLGHLPVYE